jgi:hypothetical protein
VRQHEAHGQPEPPPVMVAGAQALKFYRGLAREHQEEMQPVLAQDQIDFAVMGASAGIEQAFAQVHVRRLLLPVEVVRQLPLVVCLFQMVMANQRLMPEVSFLLEASVLLLGARGPFCLVERA